MFSSTFLRWQKENCAVPKIKKSGITKGKCHFCDKKELFFMIYLNHHYHTKCILLFKCFLSLFPIIVFFFLVDTDTGLGKAKMKVLRNYYIRGYRETKSGNWSFSCCCRWNFSSSKRILRLHPPFVTPPHSLFKASPKDWCQEFSMF